VDPEKKKPFLNAAARFGDDSTFVPGPGAYPTRASGGEDGDGESKKNQVSGVRSKGAGFGTGERRTRVDATYVGRLVLREGRFVRADGAFDETGFDETGALPRIRVGENISPEAEESFAKYRYVRAGGGFAHGISDAAASARRAAAEAAAAAARRRTAFAPGARDERKAENAGPGPGAYPLPDAWAPRTTAASSKPATSSFRAAEIAAARSSVAGRLGDSADMPSESRSPSTTLPDAGRERTDADESQASSRRWSGGTRSTRPKTKRRKGRASRRRRPPPRTRPAPEPTTFFLFLSVNRRRRRSE
jgi:hypothetical protein